jgi:hypothetical protein
MTFRTSKLVSSPITFLWHSIAESCTDHHAAKLNQPNVNPFIHSRDTTLWTCKPVSSPISFYEIFDCFLIMTIMSLNFWVSRPRIHLANLARDDQGYSLIFQAIPPIAGAACFFFKFSSEICVKIPCWSLVTWRFSRMIVMTRKRFDICLLIQCAIIQAKSCLTIRSPKTTEGFRLLRFKNPWTGSWNVKSVLLDNPIPKF